MSFIDPAMQSMLETFIHETDSELEELDEIMLESERAHGISVENINLIFRLTHTIKGSAAMMGFEGISELAHAVEDVFYIIREFPDKLEVVFDTLFDLVLEASDFLKVEVQKISSGGEFQAGDASELIDKLHGQADILNGKSTDTVEVKTEEAVDIVTHIQGDDVFKIRVYFEDGCQMEHMRAFMLMTQLLEYCEEIDSHPQNPENDPSLCDEIIKNGIVVICKTSCIDDVFKGIESALNIKSYELVESIEPVKDEEEVEEVPQQAAEVKTEETPKPTAPAAAVKQAAPPATKQSLISVNQTKLDQLMDIVGEIVTAESMVARNPDLTGLRLDNFNKSIRELRKLTDELQDVVMSIRMVPLQSTFNKMDRIVRDMSKKLEKKVVLKTEGGDTEIDKTINDAIADPFMHMIRNAMDHAIEMPEDRIAKGKQEQGTITLAARNIGGEIFIDVADDGKGLNTEALMAKAKKNGILTKPESEYTEREILGLIMVAGFSTNQAVTEYSGRGVGMDVVRRNIEQVGGSLSIASKLDVGTTFTMKIPLTLAIVEGMNLKVGGTVFTLPITSIKQSFKLSDKSQIIHNTDGSEMIMLRGECLPVHRLHDLFAIEEVNDDVTSGIMIQVETGSSSACLYADELLGEYQVVVKPFPAFFNKYNLKGLGLSGCSILGDGSISLILDTNSLLNE